MERTIEGSHGFHSFGCAEIGGVVAIFAHVREDFSIFCSRNDLGICECGIKIGSRHSQLGDECIFWGGVL